MHRLATRRGISAGVERTCIIKAHSWNIRNIKVGSHGRGSTRQRRARDDSLKRARRFLRLARSEWEPGDGGRGGVLTKAVIPCRENNIDIVSERAGVRGSRAEIVVLIVNTHVSAGGQQLREHDALGRRISSPQRRRRVDLRLPAQQECHVSHTEHSTRCYHSYWNDARHNTTKKGALLR